MISMTKTRLGAFRRPVAGCVGSGAATVFGTVSGRGSGVRWLQQHRFVPTTAVQLIAPYAVDNSTSVSAPPGRSP
jgi:hypothetical protein